MKNTIKILSTYPLDQELVEKVRHQRRSHPHAQKNSLDFTSHSFIQTTPLEEITLQDQIQDLGNTALIAIFTSAHGALAVFSKLAFRPDWKVCCLSGKTKSTVLNYLPEEAIIATADDGKSLGEKIVSLRDQERRQGQLPFTFFCGNIRMSSLPSILQTNNIPFTEIIVYSTGLTPVKLTENYDGVLFFSPSAVKSYFSLNNFSAHTIAFSIGQTTSAAIRKHTDHPILTSERPKAELVLNMVYDYFENLKT